MNIAVISNESQFFALSADDSSENVYFAPAIELEYDEPNSVVEEMEIEFVLAQQFVQTVVLPVAPVLIAAAPATRHTSHAIEQRNAA